MDTGYQLQHIGEHRGKFISELSEALDRMKEHTDELDNPYNLREGHTWQWGPDRQRIDAFNIIQTRMHLAKEGNGLALRGHRPKDGRVAKNRQWAIWKTVQLEGPQLIQDALQVLGLRYVWGAASEAVGFDCSGLVLDTTHDVTGILLPHSADLQYHDDRIDLFHEVGKAKPGDYVFMHFGRLSAGHADHVGFYLDTRDGSPYMLDTRSTSSPVGIRPIETEAVLAYGRLEEVNGAL